MARPCLQVVEDWYNRSTTTAHCLAVQTLATSLRCHQNGCSSEIRSRYARKLENDRYFDLRIRKPTVLDDLMSVANKDPRITDVVTECSHHRILSAVAVNQNVYQSKDSTQRINCHNLVLFKSPIDDWGCTSSDDKSHDVGTARFIPKTLVILCSGSRKLPTNQTDIC